ncbi:MAG: hypothetical protein ACFB16_10410 [Phormidesmis sp.]
MNAAQRPAPSASTLPQQSSAQPLRLAADVHQSYSRSYSRTSSDSATVEKAELEKVELEEASATAKAPTAYRPKRQLHKGARRALAFESSVKLTVNLLLTIVATTTIAKLVPYYQSQQQRLSTLQESVSSAEQANAELREQFDRNFDPTQAGQIMQEQSGLGYPNQKAVVWTEPLSND